MLDYANIGASGPSRTNIAHSLKTRILPPSFLVRYDNAITSKCSPARRVRMASMIFDLLQSLSKNHLSPTSASPATKTPAFTLLHGDVLFVQLCLHCKFDEIFCSNVV
ncbi:hypothetical protein GALMADRAFT_144043 [Galerina marginata CBS 339.88]|uniref:Uncharacterized protein n=1 Tax=Galerina marginata (strain CBS 339.88) TaxID=685588 RepID=A0A067SUI3_GALM3|nr:hypothetical protein GALMADRAFT_144043 [Galerina marginata CBS 339.88]